MPLLQLKLGRILNGDEPLAVVDIGGKRVQQGRLARSGAAGDEDIAPAHDDRLQDLGDLRGDAAELAQPFHADRNLAELADRTQGAVHRKRRHYGVDAAPRSEVNTSE